MNSRPTSRGRPRQAHSESLSPNDAILFRAQPQPEALFRAQAHERFYQQIQAEAQLTKASATLPPTLTSPSPEVPRRSPSERLVRRSSLFGRPRSTKSGSKPPTRDFRRLPFRVFQCILDQLQIIHTGRLSPTCSTCYMRDLAAMQRTCSAWDADARKRLYAHIDIVGMDSPEQLRKYRAQRGSRLKLLRRTLRERKLLASLVTTINVPDPNIPLYLPNEQQNPEFNQYRDLVASVVILCPNLEQLTGFHTIYNHDFNRLTHALSTRRKLKEHVWIIGENDEVTARCEKQLPPGLIDKHQRYQFLQYHEAWSNLEYLMLCSPGSAGIIEHGIFAEILSSLPALKHLCISSFDADDFADSTLSFLPDLVSLRLEECSGVTEGGLAKWSASPNAYRLRNLSLIHQNIRDLTKISKVLASLVLLRKFVMIQSDIAPTVPSDEVVFQPLIASPSLEELHWDVAPEKIDLENPMSILDSQELLQTRMPKVQGELTANVHLALSILHSGFPKLKTLRAPQDIAPPGILQAVCRPSRNRNVLLPSDKFATRPKPSVFQTDIPQTNSLHAARLRAQGYIDGNNKAPQAFMKVVVTDHSSSDNSAENTDCSNSIVSSAETTVTEADNTFSPFSPNDVISIEQGRSRSSAYSCQTLSGFEDKITEPIEMSCPWSEALLSDSCQQPTLLIPDLPIRSPLRRAQTVPVKIQEFSLPSFIGRVTSTAARTAQPPHFKLLPDIIGRDGNGGIIGWGDLLRVGERSEPVTSKAETFVKDACTGVWNRDSEKGLGWSRHVPRERRREKTKIELEHFF